MPTYEYECTKGHQFEVQQRISDDPLRTCQICRSKVRRLISSTSFVLKGGGWYSDGYSSSSKKSEKSDKSDKSDSGGAKDSSGKSASSGDSAKSSSSESSSKTSSSSSSDSSR